MASQAVPVLGTQHSVLGTAELPRPRVACFTPLSPVASGISYYSEDLLPTLARALDLTVVVDGYTPTHAAMLQAKGMTICEARDYNRVTREEPFAAAIYQLGNSPAHAYMYPRALREPGIVVLHDVVLHHLRLWMAFNGGRAQRQGYIEELRTLYGAAGEALAREVLRGKTPATLFDYPLVEPILATASAIIVHNAASAARVATLRPGTAVHIVPMGVPLPALPDRAAARARLGVPPEAFLVVSHGHVNPYKRLDVALRAFRRLAAERPDVQFLIAGSEAPGLGAMLERQIGFLGLGGRVRRLGFVQPQTVADLLAAADCCVNLRYPSAGETSASLLRIMGAGLPVIVSDAGSFSELPPGCAIKVPIGPVEEPLLAEYLIALGRDEGLCLGLGAAARAFVAEEHSLERAATGYLRVLEGIIGRSLSLPATAGIADPLVLTDPVQCNQCHDTDVAPDVQLPADPLLDEVAGALTELRLAGHEPTVRTIARDLMALGLGVAVEPRIRRRRVWPRWRQEGRR